MKKEIIRREAIKLVHQRKRYSTISLLLEEEFKYKVSPRTLRKWFGKLEQGDTPKIEEIINKLFGLVDEK